MVYIIEEYGKPKYGMKERVIVDKIMKLLNNNKYDTLEEFISRNDNYQNFLKKWEMNDVVKHFPGNLNEQNYKEILENLRKLTEKKSSFDKENIVKTNIEGHEYATLQGKTEKQYIDNTSGNSIESQMKNLQATGERFQTSSIEENSKNMADELANKKKETLNLNSLNDIIYNNLNTNEKILYKAAKSYEKETGQTVRVDLGRALIVDNQDNILPIQKSEDGEYVIGSENEQYKSNVSEGKTYQKTLVPNPNTIYSNN